MKKLLLLLLTICLASCSADDATTTTCDCERTEYIYHPPMGHGQASIPGHYEQVSSEQVCDEETSGYVKISGNNYYQVDCE